MKIDKNNPEQSWISLILRLAVGLMFALAAYGKFTMGLGNFATMVTGMFKDTFLPAWLLNPYIAVLPWAEAVAGLWLLVGCKLREAWVFTALLLISLGFGLLVAKQSAADIYTYLLVASAGLYFSKYDGGCCIGCCKPKK